METGCEPSLMLRKPARFRHVCPLLKPNAQGKWLCSVDTPQVRPFWGRALALFVGSALAVYLVGTAAAWGFLRWRGYPISYIAVVWPGEWSKFNQVQSRYFALKAQDALARNDVSEALMALSVSYSTDPSNYAVGRLYARLTQAAQPALADRVYAQLVKEHGDRRAETLAAWYESLLWRGDFNGIITLGRESIASPEGQSSAWANAILFALRREPNVAVLEQLAADAKLGALQEIFQLELLCLKDREAARAALLKTSDGPLAPYRDYFRIHRLIDLGYGAEAVNVLRRSEHRLTTRDAFGLRLHAYAELGWQPLLRSELETIATQMSVPAAELLGAHFVRHPDPGLFGPAFDAFRRSGPPRDESTYRAWSAMLAAAGVCNDFGRLREAAAEMQQITGTEVKALRAIESFFRGEGASTRIESYLPAMQPLPMEVTYALLERYYRPRQALTRSK
jgi:hypothetical protein